MTTSLQTTTHDADVDEQAAEAFAGRLFELFTGAALSYLIDIGHRTGLFAAATRGPATSTGLAERAGLNERYVREWLGAMATSGVFEYEPSTATYWLPNEHAAGLVGSGPGTSRPSAMLTTALGHHVDAVTDAFRHGGGVRYEDYLPELHDVMDALWRPLFDELLVPEVLPLAPGVTELLDAGGRAADVACGTGNAVLVLAAAFPASTFVGYDLDDRALARGRTEAARRGLSNVTFVQVDAARLRVEEPFDVVFVFNAVHDQAEPDAVLSPDPRRAGPGRHVRDERTASLQQPRGQHRQPDGAVHLRRQHTALHDGVARRRRRRPRHRLGSADRRPDARRRRFRARHHPRRTR